MEESILKRIWLRKWIQHVMNYEQGRVAIPLEKLYAIAETLSMSITDLLIEEDEIVESELPDLIKEYKKIESQELCYALIKSLFESIQICEEKIREEERIKIAKNLRPAAKGKLLFLW